MAGAGRIFADRHNESKCEMAKQIWCDRCVNPKSFDATDSTSIVDMTGRRRGLSFEWLVSANHASGGLSVVIKVGRTIVYWRAGAGQGNLNETIPTSDRFEFLERIKHCGLKPHQLARLRRRLHDGKNRNRPIRDTTLCAWEDSIKAFDLMHEGRVFVLLLFFWDKK